MEFVCESELRSDAWNSAWKSLLGSCVDFRNCIADAATFDKTIVIGLSRGQGASLVHGKCPRGAGYEASHQPRVWTAASNPVPKNGISILGRPNHGRPHARPRCLSYKAPSGREPAIVGAVAFGLAQALRPLALSCLSPLFLEAALAQSTSSSSAHAHAHTHAIGCVHLWSRSLVGASAPST